MLVFSRIQLTHGLCRVGEKMTGGRSCLARYPLYCSSSSTVKPSLMAVEPGSKHLLGYSWWQMVRVCGADLLRVISRGRLVIPVFIRAVSCSQDIHSISQLGDLLLSDSLHSIGHLNPYHRPGLRHSVVEGV